MVEAILAKKAPKNDLLFPNCLVFNEFEVYNL
jgi:hypothetical protein